MSQKIPDCTNGSDLDRTFSDHVKAENFQNLKLKP